MIKEMINCTKRQYLHPTTTTTTTTTITMYMLLLLFILLLLLLVLILMRHYYCYYCSYYYLYYYGASAIKAKCMNVKIRENIDRTLETNQNTRVCKLSKGCTSKIYLGNTLELSENAERGRSIDKKAILSMLLLILLPLLLLLLLLLSYSNSYFCCNHLSD